MQFALVNESTLVTDIDAATMARAISYQLAVHVAPAWDRSAAAMTFYPKGKRPPLAAVVFHLVNETPEAPDALGYHDETNDLPYARIGCKAVFDSGGTVLSGPLSISSVLSHEAAEAFGDLDVNGWRDMPDGRQTAEELCDAVQGDSYTVHLANAAVSVSNFLTPAWFDRQAKRGPYDYMGRCKKAFSMTKGGYLIVRTAGGEKQVFGDRPVHKKLARRGCS